LSGFDFSSIPAAATITGVVAQIRVKSKDDLGSSLCFAKLCDVDGAPTGDDAVVTEVDIGSSWTHINVGASNSVWGATLTPAIVKDTDFGVAFAFRGPSPTIDDEAHVDGVAIKIYYSVTYTPEEATATDQQVSMEMSCYHSDNKNMTKENATLTNLGLATIDSNDECVFYTDIDAKYYQFVWGQTPSVANGRDCPVSKIIVKGYVY
jgi:hypothetical protein